MRKRIPIAVGGGIAVIVASQFVNFGLGLPDDDGPPAVPSAADPSASDAEEPPTPPAPDDMGSQAADGSDPDVPVVVEAPAPAVVDVIIDEDQYWVSPSSRPEIPRRMMTREEVIAMAEDVPGESSGIVIRISRTPQAFALTEAALEEALEEAGIGDDQIDSRRQLVDWVPKQSR